MNDGILILDKPAEWTSHDCVAVCRRAFRLNGIKKIGHGGTLDPMAKGLLPVFIGQATRIMEYLELDYKTYVCRMKLGLVTDTQDVWGETLSVKATEGLDIKTIEDAFGEFRGTIEQTPPAYSAVRIDGKRLYEYARSGKSPVENVPSRKVHIRRLDIRDIDLASGTVEFEAECSKGTYIRTICHDLGEKLGCGGAMEDLKRIAIGEMTLDRSISPAEIKETDADLLTERIRPMLMSPDAPLKKFGIASLSKERADWFTRGNSTVMGRVRIEKRPEITPDFNTGRIPVNARGRRYDRIYCVYEEGSGIFLGTGYEDTKERCLKADKVFAPKRYRK